MGSCPSPVSFCMVVEMPSRRKHSVRVAGGELRGRELEYPQGRLLRPTTGRVREAVFNVLAESVHGCVFVDLFAGGGAMGIEALSRGAVQCHFVESDARVLEYLRGNVARFSFAAGRVHVHEMSVESFLDEGLAAPGRLVYADPPYESGAARFVLAHYCQTRYAELRRLVIEHRGELDPAGGFVRLDREKRYGDTTVSFFVPEEPSA